jgi:hypothetical protein
MLDSNQLSHFRERQALSLMDTCRKLVYSRTFNSFNEPVVTYAEDTMDTPCGIEQKSGREVSRDKDTIIVYDAIIRLPIIFTIDEKDRIRLTKKYGERLDNYIDYDVVSPIQRGPSGIRLLLKKVSI